MRASRPSLTVCASQNDATPLHSAAANGHVEIVRVLLANGADKMHRDKRGKTPIDVAKSQEVAVLLR